MPVQNPIALSVPNSVYSQAAIGMNPGPPCVDNSVLAQAAAIGMNAAAATFVDTSVYDQATGNMNRAPCVDSSEDGQAAIDSPAAATCMDNAVYAQVAVDINPATFLDSSVYVVAAFDSLGPCLDDPAVYAQTAIDMNPAPCLDDSLYAQAGLSPAPCVDSSVQNAQAAMDNLAPCVDDPVYRQAAVHRDTPAPRVGNSISRAQRVVGARITTTQEGHTRREVAGPMAAFQWRRVHDPAGLYTERQQWFMDQNVEHQRCRDRLAMQHRGLPLHLHSHHQEHSATARNCRSLLHRAFHMPGFCRPDAAPPRMPPMPTSILEAQYAHQLEAFTAWAVATAAQQRHPPGPLQHPISATAPIFQRTQFLWAVAEIAHQAAAIAVTQVQYDLNPLHGPAAAHRNMFNTFPPRPPAPNFPWLRTVLAGGAGPHRQQVPYHVQHQPRPHLQQQQQVVHFSRRAGGPIWTNGICTPSARTPSPYHHHPTHFTPAPVTRHYVPPAFRQEYWTNGIHTPSARTPSPYNHHPNHFTPAPLMPHYVPPGFRQEYRTNGIRTPPARTPSPYHHHPNHFTPAPVLPHYVRPGFREEYWTNGIRTPSARTPSPYHHHPNHFTPAPVMPHYVRPGFRQEYWTNGIRTPSARTPSPYHHHPNHFTPAPVMPHYVPPGFRQEYWTNGIRTPSARTPSPYHHHPNHFTPVPVLPHYVPPAFRQDHHHGQQLLHQPEQHRVQIRDIPNQMNSNPNHMRAADLAPADQYPHPHELASTSQQLQRSYYDSHYPPYQAPGSKSWQKRKGTHMHILAAIASNT